MSTKPDPRAETEQERGERLTAELALWARVVETFGHGGKR